MDVEMLQLKGEQWMCVSVAQTYAMVPYHQDM